MSVGPEASGHRVQFDRYVEIPPGALVRLPADVLALAERVAATASGYLVWQIRFERHSLDGADLESLSKALDSLTEIPESILITGVAANDGMVRVDLSGLNRVQISGTDRTWVVATEDVFLEEVRQRFPVAPRPRVWPRAELMTTTFALIAGAGVAVVILPFNLPAALAAVPVSTAVAGVYVYLFERQLIRAFTFSGRFGANFALGSGDKQLAGRSWYQHPLAEGTRLILQIVGGLWAVVQLGTLLLGLLRNRP